MKTSLLVVVLVTAAAPVLATADPLTEYIRAAQSRSPGFSPSPERGKAFYNDTFDRSSDMPGCYSCHTRDPRDPGEHVITGKTIRPMAVSANPRRFTRWKKTEKWFRRNCRELLDRECTAAEKADFITYLKEVRS